MEGNFAQLAGILKKDDYDDQENDDNDEFFQSAATISDLNSSIKEIAPTISPIKFQLRSPVDTVASSTEVFEEKT